MNKKTYKLKKSLRFIICVILMLVEIGTCSSSGILSSASKGIKKQLKMTDIEFGLFGYWNSNGRLAGALCFMLIFYKFDRKWLIGLGILIKGILLSCFYFISNAKYLFLFRFLTGLCHMIPSIYIPIWLDQYGIYKLRPHLQVTYIAFSSIGKATGYGLTVLFGEESVYYI